MQIKAVIYAILVATLPNGVTGQTNKRGEPWLASRFSFARFAYY